MGRSELKGDLQHMNRTSIGYSNKEFQGLTEKARSKIFCEILYAGLVDSNKDIQPDCLFNSMS